jgi:MULE transposase domain
LATTASDSHNVSVPLKQKEDASYEELVPLHMTDRERLQPLVQKQGSLLLAVDGLKPDVGHEVLWVVRDCVSGEILLARSLLSEREADLVTLLKEVQDAFSVVPIRGVISDGQKSIRNAVATAFPDIPHQLCHFHYLPCQEYAQTSWARSEGHQRN